jgi:hypothetical protein
MTSVSSDPTTLAFYAAEAAVYISSRPDGMRAVCVKFEQLILRRD